MTLFQAFGQFAGQAAFGPIVGWDLVIPSSINYTTSGGSASISADGRIDMTQVTSLSVNDCFSSDYRNYMVIMRSFSSAAQLLNLRLRASGSDASGTDYSRQSLYSSGATLTAAQQVNQTSMFFTNTHTANYSNTFCYFSTPFQATPTMSRVGNMDANNVNLFELASYHNLSTSYDGFTWVYGTGGSWVSGNMMIYGMKV